MTFPKVLFSSRNMDWATPPAFFAQLNDEFDFTLDACASSHNTKCQRFFSERVNGLKQNWKQERVFCNPPYGKHLPDWTKKCFEASQAGALVVALLPASTSTRWFHQWVLGKAELRFLKGRLKFVGAEYSAPFGSLVAVYRPMVKSKQRVKRQMCNLLSVGHNT